MRISDWSSDVCSSDLETPQGLRLVIEIDGGQHGSDAAQAHVDKQRDSELNRVGWAVWRIPTSALDDTARVGQEGLALIESRGAAAPEGARDAAAPPMFWAATALSSIQVRVLEAMLADRKVVVEGKSVTVRRKSGGR